ncbi:MAG: hypothetical protein HZB42_15485 [Sphingobacteriales bacterium]|nr:hypothetical protein [Sphingobacteriales bacterium]
MKPILYAGAALMIGATIYGFVDYEKTKQKKEFSKMYTDEANRKAVNADVKTATDKTVTVNTAEVKKAEITTDKPVVNSNEEKTVKKKTKQRKFRLEEFSRAPIREEVIEMPAPVKKESKANENKEQ